MTTQESHIAIYFGLLFFVEEGGVGKGRRAASAKI
jgi:hypothetical protein